MLKQSLHYKLSQKLSPQQIQLMKLIQLPTQAFEQRLKQELEENPALESGKDQEETYEESFDSNDNDMDNEQINADDINIDDYLSDDEIPEYRLQANNYSSDDEQKTIPFASGTSFTQHLIDQLNTFPLEETHQQIAEFLIGSIDDSGYIRRPLLDIMDDLAFTQNIIVETNQIEKVVKAVQSLDPPGIGARSLQECLQLQLEKKKKDRPEVGHALKIIKKEFDHFSHKHYTKLQERIGINQEELKIALDLISKLNPKP